MELVSAAAQLSVTGTQGGSDRGGSGVIESCPLECLTSLSLPHAGGDYNCIVLSSGRLNQRRLLIRLEF